MSLLTTRRAALLLPAALLLKGCASAPPPAPPTTLSLTIKAGPDQNPDPTGAPAPVAIAIYQLASSGAFGSTEFFALTNAPAATLGQDLIATESYVVAPGETKLVAHGLMAATQFLGVAVEFRDINHAVWRQVVPVTAHAANNLQLTTAKLNVTLAPAS
jgi:type VI secretion system protein VasD